MLVAKGRGVDPVANAAAFAFYQKQLNRPGLTDAQKTLLYQAQGPFAPVPPGGAGGVPGAGAAAPGFGGPTSAGGRVFNAQQALIQARAGGGANFYQQMSAAKAYLAASTAAYNNLVKQVVPLTQQAAKQRELTTLAKDEEQARKAIADILQKQYQSNVSRTASSIAAAKQNYQLSQSTIENDRQRIIAAQHYLAILQKHYAILEKQYKLHHDSVRTATELEKITLDEQAARHDIRTARAHSIIDSILGIGGSGGLPSIPRLETRLRGNFLGLIRRLFHPIGGGRAGEITNPFAMFPGATTESIPKLIKQMQDKGINIPKSSLRATNEILMAIHKAYQHGVKLSSAENSLIAAKITQMNQTFKTVTDYPKTYKLASYMDIVHGLSGFGSRRGRGRAASRIIESEIFGGLLPTMAAVQGIPITNSGANMQARGSVYAAHVTININGANKDPKVIAAEVRQALLKDTRRNRGQTRGISGGRSVGLG
jgi:hypothetical protein